MMLHRPNLSLVHNRPRSNSHPVHPQRIQKPSESDESVPVRPPRNPARPVTLGEEQLAPPPTRAPVDDSREGDRDTPPVNVPPPKSPVNRKPPQATFLPQINTLDRKIPQEPKRSMLARSAQFALKNNTKHHPFPPDEVPYPRSYDHKCIDTDVWETVFCEQFCRNVTFHTFEVPPTKVLDLGCGSGSWIMTCARQWKDCHFVGLDIVPLHPDLGQLELSQRVSWVQANFLEPLPFPNEEFDLVHIKRIARGVPEYKWDALFEEIIRVMKPGAALEMLEEDLYIPGQMMETADNDSPLSILSSSGSSEGLSQAYAPSIPGPSTSLSDISTEQSYSGSKVIRGPTSERHTNRSRGSPTTSTLPPPLSIRSRRSNPENVRPFPLLKPSNPTARPISSHFKLHNLLQKRSGRDGGARTNSEQPRKNKESPVPIIGLYPLLIPESPVTLNQKHSPKRTHRPVSSGGRLPPSKPYLNATGTSSNLMLRSNASINIPIPTQKLHELGERGPSLAVPPVESANGKLGVDFPRNGHNDDPGLARTRSFSYPTPEDDEQRRSTPSREFEPFDLNAVGMHDHAQQVRHSNTQNSQNSGVLADMEPIASNRRDKKLTVVSPPLPLKDIPRRSKPQAISSRSSLNEIPRSTTGLSRSVPDRFDRNRDQLLSPTPGSSKPMKSLSTSSLAISASRSTGRVPVLLQNSHSSDNSSTGNAINSPNPDIPPNPRQHKLLEVMYTEMHAARFVNLAPLSLLENYIRSYFRTVCTHAPLVFTFPPPPGCEHRPEFDAAELRQQKLDQTRKAEDDDDQDLIFSFPSPPGYEHRSGVGAAESQQGEPARAQKVGIDHQDRYFEPDTPLSTRPRTSSLTAPELNSPRSLLLPSARERSLSITSNEPGPSRTRSSSTKSTRPSITDPKTADHQQPRSRGSGFFVGHGDGTVPDRFVVTGDELLTGTSEYMVMDTSMTGGFSPARVARAAKKSTPSVSNEQERSRQRSDSLFTRTTGKGEGVEGRKRSLASVPKLTRPPPVGPLPPPPSLFEYETPNAISSVSLPLSMASSSSSTTIQHDSGKGKQGLTMAERAQLNTFPNRKAEIDIRSLNLHLRARVIEILGCSEAMWDWVREFQHKELEKEKKRKKQQALAARTVQGVGGGRVSYYHRDRVRSSGRERKNSAESDLSILRRKKPTKGFPISASKKKREDDGCDLDGDSQGNVAESPTSYCTTSFGSVRGDDPSEYMEKSVKEELLRMTRVRFDEVLSWFQFDMDDSIRLTRSMATRTPSSSFRTDLTEQRKSFNEACQKLETYLSLVKPDGTVNGCGSTSGSSQDSQPCEALCCLPPLLNLVHPSKRLCRTMRVWVAWKP